MAKACYLAWDTPTPNLKPKRPRPFYHFHSTDVKCGVEKTCGIWHRVRQVGQTILGAVQLRDSALGAAGDVGEVKPGIVVQ
jgi:hypothetical protein